MFLEKVFEKTSPEKKLDPFFFPDFPDESLFSLKILGLFPFFSFLRFSSGLPPNPS